MAGHELCATPLALPRSAKKAGVKEIDYLVITHYHDDHVGGVPQLAAKLPIRNFVDHGAKRGARRPCGTRCTHAYVKTRDEAAESTWK